MKPLLARDALVPTSSNLIGRVPDEEPAPAPLALLARFARPRRHPPEAGTLGARDDAVEQVGGARSNMRGHASGPSHGPGEGAAVVWTPLHQGVRHARTMQLSPH